MKKMVKWFSVLQANNVDFKLSETAKEENEDKEQGVEVTAPGTADGGIERTENR